jgi:formate dehydrogenase major subunit
MSPELAAELGVRNGGWVTLRTARAEATARALVTRRIAPLVVDGVARHHVAAPYHYGRKGLVVGDPLNELFALSGEPNTTIQGSKVISVAVEAGRGATGRNVVTSGPLVADLQPPQGIRRDIEGVGTHVRGAHGYLGPASRAHGLEEE